VQAAAHLLCEWLGRDPAEFGWKKTGGKKQQQKPDEAEGWQKFLQLDDGGKYETNLANAMTALRSAPELVDIATYDLMQRHALVTRSLPGSRMAKVTDPRQLADADVSAIQEWLQRHDLRRMGKLTTHQAVELVAQEHAFHPVRDYLGGLKWDGKRRLCTWLHVYAGAADTAYEQAIGEMFLISMVARIEQPGCQCDYMLVLEGLQGAMKTRLCKTLAGEWYSDGLPDLHNADRVRVSMHLRGKWLIEIGEMSAISKAEDAALKLFLTQTHEQFTPKYGHLEVKEPRQNVFIGTTNKKTYLRDETGARRYWPVITGKIDINGLAQDRDQIFAEAVCRYRDGAHWWPTREFEVEQIKPQQDARYEADAWEQAISVWLATKATSFDKDMGLTVVEVAKDALGFDEAARVGTADQRRITAALERLGWERGERTMHGRPWVRRQDA
jgi:predicted P-loop ATPase